MDSASNEQQSVQEVTVEVLPDTVTEIIYLPDGEIVSNESTYYVPSEEEVDNEESTEYEIGCVDTARLRNRDLVLDQSETFVLLSADNTLVNSGTLYVQNSNEETNNEEEMILGEQFDCMHCNFKTTSFDSLQTHQTVHGEDETCKICGKSFPNAALLSRHHKEEHEIYSCNICHSDYIGRKLYSAHVRQHDNRKYICYKCDATFDSGEKLMNHMETHGTVLLYACNKCDEAFSSTIEVSTHLRQVHARHKETKKDIVKIHQKTPKQSSNFKPR